jgi:hypothetical protein
MTRKLILHAGEPAHPPPESTRLAQSLRELGLIAAPLPDQSLAWYAGADFLSLVIFLGCSPQVEFRPIDAGQAEAGRFCHVRYQNLAHPVLRHAAGRLQPRCSACRGQLEVGQERVRDWSEGGNRVLCCPACGQDLRVSELDWRQAAGCGRWFLEFWNIHPHEAVPAEALLAALERLAGTPLRYFYE